MKKYSIFLIAPLTATLVEIDDNIRIEKNFRSVLNDMHVGLRSAGHTVISAHEREDWGAKLFPPAKAIIDDLRLIREAGLIVGLVGDPPSPGVQLEIGYAIAFSKPILLFHTQPVDRIPYLCQGVEAVTVAKISQIPSGDLDRDAIGFILGTVSAFEFDGS